MPSKKETLKTEIQMGGITLNPGECIGPYRYERPIGKGGMADVLLSHDPNGTPMALKVLKESRFKTGRRRFRREFRALAKLRHPNVILVDSYGDIFGHPYIAMEYVEGMDLHKTIRNFKNLSLAARWERTEEILTDLGRGLACIHSQGLVHRDLKPSNVLVSKDGDCKITDFGIVKDLVRDPDASATLVGTWAYASPEQISGQTIDHRSDLYSLGIILFAMLTGRRPFSAENMAGYLKLHRDKPPRAPSSLVPEVPHKLESICMRLLQKSPQDRFQSANEILEILGERNKEGEAEDPGAPWQPPIGGRSNLLEALHGHMARLNQGEGGLLLLRGGEGMGKSRLLSEMYQHLRKQELPTFRGRISPGQSAVDMVAEFARHVATESGDGELNFLIQAFDKSKETPDADMRHQLFDRTQAMLQKLAEERPQIFLVDDIHHAQGLLQELINYLAGGLLKRNQLPLLFVATSDSPQEWLATTHSYQISPLQSEGILEILDKMGCKDKGLQLLAERLHQETDGIPVFLTEFLRDLIQRKVIDLGPPCRFNSDVEEIASKLDLPPGLRQLARHSYGKLGPVQQSIVKLLATAGRETEIDILLDCVDEEEDNVLDALEELQKSGVIVSRKAGLDPLIDLSRRKFGEVIYGDIEAEERRRLHLSLAKRMEGRGAIGISAAQQIGEHYRMAQEGGKAFQFLSVAALRLWERGLAADALGILKIAPPLIREAKSKLENKDFLTSRLQLLQVQSSASENRGEWREAAKTLRSMLRYAKELGDWRFTAAAELGLGRVSENFGQVAAAEARVRSVLEKAEARRDNHTAITALHHLSAFAWKQGDLDSCESLAKLGLERSREGELRLARAHILLSLSAVDAARGRLESAAEGMREAEQLFSQLLRKKKQGTVLCNLAEVMIWQGSWWKSLDLCKRSMTLSNEAMNRAGMADACMVQAMAYHDLGMEKESLDVLNRGLRISRMLSRSSNLIVARILLAKIALSKAEYEVADAHLLDGIRIATTSDPEHYMTALQTLQAHALSGRGKPRAAKQILAELSTQMEDLACPKKVQAQLYAADAWHHIGDIGRANSLAGEAYELSMERGMWGWTLQALAQQVWYGGGEELIDELEMRLDQLSMELPERFHEPMRRRYGLS